MIPITCPRPRWLAEASTTRSTSASWMQATAFRIVPPENSVRIDGHQYTRAA